MSVTAKPTPAAAPRDPAVPDVPIYRLSVEQYHAMAVVFDGVEVGALPVAELLA